MTLILMFDSTPLIYLARTGVLEKLKELGDELVIPHLVHGEVVIGGMDRGAADALLVDRCVKEGMFRIVYPEQKKPSEYFGNIPGLHEADAETLAIARELQGIAVMDEAKGRRIAEIEGIEVRGSIYLLFRLLKADVLSGTELRRTLDSMIGTGWRCSTELYGVILAELDDRDD